MNKNSDVDPESEENLANAHFNDPEINTFEAGPAPVEANENRRICLKNVPSKLNREAIAGLLSQFGNLVDINIPKNQDRYKDYKDGFVLVFAEFSNFNEAEKAIRELNDLRNKSLKINASFALPKRQAPQEQNLEDVIKNLTYVETTQDTNHGWTDISDEEEEKEDPSSPPINLEFFDSNDEVNEKVSDFKRKPILLSTKSSEEYEFFKKLAEKSADAFNIEKESFILNNDIFEEVESHKCHQCLQEALLICKQTSLMFCSVKCSVSGQETKKSEPLLRKNQINYSEAIKKDDQVVISAVISERCVYVRKINTDSSSLLNNVRKLSKKAQKLESLPEVGDLVLATYFDDVFRAKVFAVSEKAQSVNVVLIDNGNTAKVELPDILTMEPECQKLQCFAHKVLLKNVKVDSLSWELVDFLNQLVKDGTKLTVEEIENGEAVLVNKLAMLNVNRKVVELSTVPEASYNEVDPPMFNNSSTQIMVTIGRHQRVFIVNTLPCPDGSSLVCCISEENLRDFLELYKMINVYGNTRQSREYGVPLKKGTICLAFANGQWHRAFVTKTTGDAKPECLLLDIAKLHRIKVTKIIPMPKVFDRQQPMVEVCKVLNADNNFDELLENGLSETVNKLIEVEEIMNVDGEIVLKI